MEGAAWKRHPPRPAHYLVDTQPEQMYFVPVLLRRYPAPQCGSENPRLEKDMLKKKPTAKSKKLRSAKKLEKQKPLLKYNLDNVLISSHNTSGHEGGAGS